MLVVTGTVAVVPVGKEVTVDGDADPLKMKEDETVVGNVNDADEDADGKADETVVGIVNDADEDAEGKENVKDEDADGKDEDTEEIGNPLEIGQLVSVTVTVMV